MNSFFAFANGLAMNSFFTYANGLAMNSFFAFANGLAILIYSAKEKHGGCMAHGTYIATRNKKEELITPHKSTYIVLFLRLLA